MADIESAAALVERIEGQLALTATTVEFTAATDLELTVGEQTIRLSAGERWAPTSSSSTTVELPGLMSVRIDPGVTTSNVQAKLECRATGSGRSAADRVVPSTSRARGRSTSDAGNLTGSRDQLAATLAGLTEGDGIGRDAHAAGDPA